MVPTLVDTANNNRSRVSPSIARYRFNIGLKHGNDDGCCRDDVIVRHRSNARSGREVKEWPIDDNQPALTLLLSSSSSSSLLLLMVGPSLSCDDALDEMKVV